MNKSPEHNHQQVTQQVAEKYSSTSHSKRTINKSGKKNKAPEKNHQQVTRQVSQRVSQQTLRGVDGLSK